MSRAGGHGGGPSWAWRGSLRPPPPRVGRQATPETWRDSGRGKFRAPAPLPAPSSRVSAVILRATPRGQGSCESVHCRILRIRHLIICLNDLGPRLHPPPPSVKHQSFPCYRRCSAERSPSRAGVPGCMSQAICPVGKARVCLLEGGVSEAPAA